MDQLIQIFVHQSQFPDRVEEELRYSLRSRSINHKFLYDSVKQAQKWLRLHRAYSPIITDPSCLETYQAGCLAAADWIGEGVEPHVVALGCGAGEKDLLLLRALKSLKPKVLYSPCDVSTALVLTAAQAAKEVVTPAELAPLVCDLAGSPDWEEWLGKICPPCRPRLLTFFGMIPNFQPQDILSKLGKVLRAGECLLLSANLAPGPDYEEGVRQVFACYDNELTRDWLLSFLFGLGFERSDGELRFEIEIENEEANRIARIAAYFHFDAGRVIETGTSRFEFSAGEKIRVFFSYRHTPALLSKSLAAYGIQIKQSWVNTAGDEGVFLCVKSQSDMPVL